MSCERGGGAVIRTELIDQLVRITEVRLEVSLDGDEAVEALRRSVRADRMLDGDERTAAYAIARMMATLYPGDEPFDPPADSTPQPAATRPSPD